jgi:hypothetical protein
MSLTRNIFQVQKLIGRLFFNKELQFTVQNDRQTESYRVSKYQRQFLKYFCSIYLIIRNYYFSEQPEILSTNH